MAAWEPDRRGGRIGRRAAPGLPPLPLLRPLRPWVGVGLSWAAGLWGVACSHGPPADFAPSPALVARITGLRINTAPGTVCPGGQIQADYEAVLNDGSTVLFERRYDKKRPPPLHVVFLRRSSPEAIPQEDGDWTTNRDPLASAMNGFRLTAFLIAQPSINGAAHVRPEYSCVPPVFSFPGGLPEVLETTGGSTAIVRIVALGGELDTDSARLYTRAGSEGPFTETPVAHAITSYYEATFPATPCGSTVEYYFEIDTAGGQTPRTIRRDGLGRVVEVVEDTPCHDRVEGAVGEG